MNFFPIQFDPECFCPGCVKKKVRKKDNFGKSVLIYIMKIISVVSVMNKTSMKESPY